MAIQLELFPLETVAKTDLKTGRSGTFADNMKLPVHRWFRYSAGFSAEWVEEIIENCGFDSPQVFDPFVGSGTVAIAADRLGVNSIGIEAHPFVHRIAKAKTFWSSSIVEFENRAIAILEFAKNCPAIPPKYPSLITRSFSPDSLTELHRLKLAWESYGDRSPASELAWLAVTAILRVCSGVGTAQWQYILPNKTKKKVIPPLEAFVAQVELMKADMRELQELGHQSAAKIVKSDARNCPEIPDRSIDLVITSPPYANNYDYADATRFELSFWGEIDGWGDLHEAVRQYLIVSSSQHASRSRLSLETLLNSPELQPIREEIAGVCDRLSSERLLHGGKKHYHTMIAAYFVGMAKVWSELKRVCHDDSKICFVIGDSAPYGIHVPVDRWLGELAIASGFADCEFDKLRDRNTKWKNRKHRFPLHEGILWVANHSRRLNTPNLD